MRNNKKELIEYRYIFVIIVISTILFFSFLFLKNKYRFGFDNSVYKSILKKVNTREGQLTSYNFSNLTSKSYGKFIVADSYVVYDLVNNKIIEGRNENKMYALASVTKLMTAYVANMDCKDALKKELDSLLIASDNNAADYIAANCPNSEDFVKSMNNYAVKNNLKLTFVNPSGLDIKEETEASNFGDAVSVAKLLDLLYKKDRKILSHTTRDTYGEIKNTNTFADNLPFLIGSKTGYTDLAGGNLATIYEPLPGSRIAIVVLSSTKEARFQDTFYLLKSYLENAK